MKISAILPWKNKAERKAAVAAAERQAEKSARSAGEAAEIEHALRRMVAQNHFADNIQALITGQEIEDR